MVFKIHFLIFTILPFLTNTSERYDFFVEFFLCNFHFFLDTNQSQNNHENERKIRRLKRNADWNWLNACIGVIEGDPNPVEAYLSSGGDPARTLTASEVAILNRSSAFDVGHTLVHLAIR